MTYGRVILSLLLKPVGIHRLGGLRLLRHFGTHPIFTLSMLRASKSQICQDVFVACQLGLWNRSSAPGYFVEFGATDGISMSNTYIFEKRFGWNGLLIEPARIWKNQLIKNRTASFDFRCVFDSSGEKVAFNESENAVYSTIQNFSKNDRHADERVNGGQYLVETVSLNNVLEHHKAPKTIDYLSIDTEGSEFQILQALDFDAWTFRVITVEHNYTDQRSKIYELLTRNGYKRVLENISYMDDWYVKC
jgi:FkbM family methyltransferase